MKGLYARFTEKLGKKKLEEMVWREDMPELVLELLRKRVRDKLRWHFKQSGQLVPCASPRSDDVDGIEHVSCVLYFGSLQTPAGELHKQTAAIIADADKWVSYYIKNFPKQLDPHKKAGISHSSPLWYTEPLVPRLQPRLRFPPLDFKTTIWRGRKVAVYSLYDLLGEEKARELIDGSRFEAERCLVMKTGRHSVPVEMLLMQLQMYLAEPTP